MQNVRQTSKDMKKFTLGPIFLLTLFLGGCVFTSATRLNNNEELPEQLYEDVIIYLDEESIEGDWEEVAILHGEADAVWTDQARLLRAMKRRAAKVGANGILFEPIEEPSAWAKIAGEVLDVGSSRYANMIAIIVYEVE